MKYFDQVTFTINVMRKKVCVDISLFSVFSYSACAIASEVINIMSKLTSPFDSPTSNYVRYKISSHLLYKQGHYANIFNFGTFGKKCEVITPLWCLKAPSPATKKWILEFCTTFGFRNHLQTFWPRWLVKSELSLGLDRYYVNIITPEQFCTTYEKCIFLSMGYISALTQASRLIYGKNVLM